MYENECLLSRGRVQAGPSTSLEDVKDAEDGADLRRWTDCIVLVVSAPEDA